MIKKKWFNSAFDTKQTNSSSFSQPQPQTSNNNSEDKSSMRKTRSQSSFTDLINDSKKSKLSETSSGSVFLNAEDEDDDLVVVSDDYEKKRNDLRSVDWLEKFKPTKVEELCVHPKKIEELLGWFELYEREQDNNPNRILLLTGPSGSAKTIALKLIAKSFNFEIIEWINSIDVENDLYSEPGNFRKFKSYENQVDKFLDFLLKSSRYGSIFSKKNRILLVKDFPNTFLKKSEEFWDVLRQYKSLGNSPLVFILTETNSRALNIAYNLFPDNVRHEFLIESISFNPVSVTLLKKAVKRVCSLLSANPNFKEFFTQPASNVIDELVDQASGDIRNLILNLNFSGQKGNGRVKLTSHKGKSKGKQKKQDKTSGMGRNEVLTTMHGLGRCFYPKYEIDKETNIEMLTHRPESITESFITQPRTFIELIHSNYIKNIQNLSDLSELSNIYSLNDIFMTEYRDLNLHDLNLDLVIRATMVMNRHPAPGFRPIGGFADKKFKDKELMQAYKGKLKILNNGNLLGKNDYFCDYHSYLKFIDVSERDHPVIT